MGSTMGRVGTTTVMEAFDGVLGVGGVGIGDRELGNWRLETVLAEYGRAGERWGGGMWYGRCVVMHCTA